MTWGEIDGTPFRLDGEDDAILSSDAPVFKMPEIPIRDQIRDTMYETFGKRHSERNKNAFETTAKTNKYVFIDFIVLPFKSRFFDPSADSDFN